MVYFFVPNLIGYARVLLAAGAFYVAFEKPLLFFVLYALSELLDAVDGYAARYFHQSTKYGAVLDMVTDRCCTTALLVVLSRMYPNHTNLFILIIAVDLSSHYAHLCVSVTKGATSHKDVDKNTNIFLRLYYGSRVVLFTLCAANEAIFLFPYAMNFGPEAFGLGFDTKTIAYYAFFAALPLGALKQFMNLVQMVNAFAELAAMDRHARGEDETVAADKKRQSEIDDVHEKAEAEGKATVALRTRKSIGATPHKTPKK